MNTGVRRTILACDLGGTRMKFGLLREGGIVAQTSIAARSEHGLAPQLPAVKAAWLQLLTGAGWALSDCLGVSMAFPSLIDARTGRILDEYGKYPDALQLDLRAWVRVELGLRLAIENDARMALIGEWQLGAGRGYDNVVMITLGTGLGTAAILEGQVLRGCHGQAGVLGGHSTVQVGGRLCHCGNIGCAEAQASTGRLSELASTSDAFSTSSLRHAAPLDYAAVFKAAQAGDECAVHIRDESLRVWGALAVNLIHAYDPEVVLLGGGIMGSADVVLPSIRSYVERYAHTPWGHVRVLPAALGEAAPLLAGDWLLAEMLANP